MKIFFLLLGGILFLNLNFLSAQKLFLGPELGVNLSPTIETGNSQNYQLGVNGGLRLSYAFNDKLSLKSGIYFTQKYQAFDSSSVGSLLDVINDALGGIPGGGLDVEGLLSEIGGEGLSLDVNRQYQGTIQSNFIEIPLEIEVKTGRVGFSIGGYAAYMISAESNATITENTPLLQVIDIEEVLDEIVGGFGGLFSSFLPKAYDVSTKTNTSKNGYNEFDYGIRGGISYTSSDNLVFNLSYQHGLRDYRYNRPVDLEETNINENAFAAFKNVTFTMAYQFGLKKKADSVFMP
jgi:hypothetical protein